MLAFKKLLFSFLLFWSVCYEDGLSDSKRNEIASLMFRNFNNSQLPNGTFLLKYLTDRKFKMSTIFIFEIKGAKKVKIFNFLKSRFSIMDGLMDVIFGAFLGTYARLLKSITSQFFSRYSKSYNNLNVKSCSMALNKEMDRVGATKLYAFNTTL